MSDVYRRPQAVKHQRIPTLDGWRAVAILAVLFAHLRWPSPWLTGLPDFGNWGVQLFFALSGFLITSRLLDEYEQLGRIRWTDFYIRRVFRILPPAFFTLLVLALLGLVFHLIPMDLKQLLASVFFYRNYYVGQGWYTAHFWSLAVEEQFYLVWPAILCIVGVARGARAAIALACAAVVWRALDTHFDWIAHFQPLLRGADHRTDYRIGQLFWGCALAYLWRSEPLRRAFQKLVRSYWAVPLIAAQMLLLFGKPSGYEGAVEVLMALLPIVTIADPKGIVGRMLETRPAIWIGHLSYSLYLWQQPFVQSRLPQQALGVVPGLAACVALTFAAAAFSYYVIERPSIKFGRRMQQRLNCRRKVLYRPGIACC